MTMEKMIREKISEIIYEKMDKKVRNIFFICRTDHNSICYGVSGNNGKLFAIVEYKSDGTFELIA